MVINAEKIKNMLNYIDNVESMEGVENFDSEELVKKLYLDIFEVNIITGFEQIVTELNTIFKTNYFPTEWEEFVDFTIKEIFLFNRLPKEEYRLLVERVVQVEREMDEVQAYNDELLQKIERAISDTERLIINLEKQCNDLRHDFQPYADKYNEKINLVHNVIPKLQADKYNCNYYNEELKKQRQQLERADLKKKAVSIAMYDVGQDEWAYYLTDFERYKELYYGDVDYSISLKFRRSLQMLIEEMQPLIGKADYVSVLEKKLSRYKYKSEDVERVRKDNVLAYMELLKDNVLEYNVCDYILCMINCNHILSKRGELIQKAISCFADNEYIQFINIIAIQIEGLFFDIYTQLGFSPRKLDAISLKPKVEEIDRKTNEIGTGYFMFYFPILRNKVAHGILWDSEELERIAYETLLDLQYLVFVIAETDSLPIVAFIQKIDKITETKYKYISLRSALVNGDIDGNINYLMNSMYDDIFSFYGMTDKIRKIRDDVFSQQFFDTIIENFGKDRRYITKYNKLVDSLHRYAREHCSDKAEMVVDAKKRMKDLKRR